MSLFTVWPVYPGEFVLSMNIEASMFHSKPDVLYRNTVLTFRSASFILAYLISSYNLTLQQVIQLYCSNQFLDSRPLLSFTFAFCHHLIHNCMTFYCFQALCHLKIVRPWVNPNKGFLSQLRSWEEQQNRSH